MFQKIVRFLFGPKTARAIMYDLSSKAELLRSSEEQWKEMADSRRQYAKTLEQEAVGYDSEAVTCSKIAGKIEKLF